MQIEVKNIRMVPGHDDSHSYNAVIYINGVKAFNASNDGWGGPDMYHAVDGYTGPSEQEINAWLAQNTPKITGEGLGDMVLDNNLEIVVGEAINDFLHQKEVQKVKRKFDKMLATKILALNTKGELLAFKAAPTGANLQAVRTKRPELQVINGADEQLMEKGLKAYCPDL